jgi:hypothetical protein
MTVIVETELHPASAAPLMRDLGFLAMPDLPDRPGPACLLVALRDVPTLRHYDPEKVQYWASEDGRGVRRTLTRRTSLPIVEDFSWGMIRLVDRLQVTNEYLTFGGRLMAERVDGVDIAVFTSPAPLLRRGGHSQAWDRGADMLGAWFGRLLVAVDFEPGFEAEVARAGPAARYAAFLAEAASRYGGSRELRAAEPGLWTLVHGEADRLRTERPVDWARGQRLLGRVHR